MSFGELVRGDDGLTYLFVDAENISVEGWNNAVKSGVVAVVKPNGAGWSTDQYVTRETFAELSLPKPSEGLYHLPSFVWSDGTPEGFLTPQDRSEGHGEAPVSETFVNLHTHTEYSALDGYATVRDNVLRVKAMGQTAVAATDHGWCAGHPELQEVCDEEGIKPIFGLEAYLVEDRFSREDLYSYHHLVLWALDDEGLDNLWAMSTESHRDGFFEKYPRLDYDTLKKFNKGVAASTACLRGPVTEPYLKGNVAKALENLSRLKAIFEDRLYVEIHMNTLPEQIKANHWLVARGKEFDIPLLAAQDSHYADKEQRDDHQVWISMQVGKDVSAEGSLFSGGQDYHLASEEEAVIALSYLGEEAAFEAIKNTAVLADRCTARITPKSGLPRYSVGPDAEQQDVDRLFDLCIKNWDSRVKGKSFPESDYLARFEREMDLLIRKGFPGYFLMNADLVGYAKANGVLVGPGRGSGAGSLVAYLCGITEVDPIEHDLLFERFMTEGRTALPDFDIDYPSSRKQFMIEYAQKRWGSSHVVAVGTYTRIRNKSAFKDTSKAIKSRLGYDAFNDVEAICRIITQAEASTAGLGLSFDVLMAQCEAEFAPYQERLPYLFEMAGKFHERLKTYSRHAAGLVIDPGLNLETSLPLMMGSNGTLVTQFDKDTLERLGYVKFDFLNLRNLDTIQDTVDLIFAKTGEFIDVNKWREEYNDEMVYSNISKGWTLGGFQIETTLGTRTVKQLKPKSISDLADCITIGRPGPMRSGLDKLYFRRREGKEKVKYPDPRMEAILSKTQGVMLYQEDIMALCIVLAEYTSDAADKVRKILGKKKPEDAAKEGKTFIAKAIANNVDPKVAEDLWAQMAEFALYSFNRAHAASYATLAYWTAWLKFHYPTEFMTACLTTIEQNEIPPYISEARRMGQKILPPDINDSKEGFTAAGNVIRFGLASINGIGGATLSSIIPFQPFASFEDFLERKGPNADKGVIKTLAKIGAFDSLEPNRKALELRLTEENEKPYTRCVNYDLEAENPSNGLPCRFDWLTEAPEIGRTGKPLKLKPPSKRCATSCRQFKAKPLTPADEVEPYTDKELRDIEMELLGVYLSSSPFDIIAEQDLDSLTTGDDLQEAAPGTYLMAVIITGWKDHTTKDGKLMKFLRVTTSSGDSDITLFSSKLDEYEKYIKVGQMAFVEVLKNSRGVSLKILEPF